MRKKKKKTWNDDLETIPANKGLLIKMKRNDCTQTKHLQIAHNDIVNGIRFSFVKTATGDTGRRRWRKKKKKTHNIVFVEIKINPTQYERRYTIRRSAYSHFFPPLLCSAHVHCTCWHISKIPTQTTNRIRKSIQFAI